MKNILDEIKKKKEKEVKKLYQEKGMSFFEINNLKNKTPKKSFAELFKGKELKLIAEIKKASPSKGIINTSFDPLTLAKKFQKKGATALSVLTDKKYFQGDINFISLISAHCNLPILRKDFIIDPIQIYEAKYYGASAILLIKNLLKKDELIELLLTAKKLNLETLVEIHTLDEWESIKNINTVNMIGINNRNLETFEVNTQNAIEIKRHIKNSNYKGVCIAESGYENLNQVQEISREGFQGVLIGEGLIKNPELLLAFRSN
ncbi:MAG: indole-3-glycerol phosphate synthase TrpC [bacterium]